LCCDVLSCVVVLCCVLCVVCVSVSVYVSLSFFGNDNILGASTQEQADPRNYRKIWKRSPGSLAPYGAPKARAVTG
jgi:hypothetical protein